MHWIAAPVLALALVGCSHEPPVVESKWTEPADTKPIAMAVVGDSFTAGTEFGGLGGKSWPHLATLKLREQGIDVAIAKAAQEGAGWVEPNSKGAVFASEAKGQMGPTTQLVVLFGSLNDGSVASGVLADTVTRTLDTVRQDAPNAKILVIGPPTLGRATDNPAKMTRVRDAVKSAAEMSGATFVDPIAENWFSDPAWIGADGVHPSDSGHQMMADRITPLIAAQVTT